MTGIVGDHLTALNELKFLELIYIPGCRDLVDKLAEPLLAFFRKWKLCLLWRGGAQRSSKDWSQGTNIQKVISAA